MIKYRLDLAGGNKQLNASLFSFLSYWLIYGLSKGYPRKIINLCHQIILTLIIQDRTQVSWRLTLSSAKRLYPARVRFLERAGLGVLATLILLVGITVTKSEQLSDFVIRDNGMVVHIPHPREVNESAKLVRNKKFAEKSSPSDDGCRTVGSR